MKHFIRHCIFAAAMIGAANWGIIGLFNFNIISYFLGEESAVCRLVYILIGACAVFSATYAVIDCKCNVVNRSKKPPV